MYHNMYKDNLHLKGHVSFGNTFITMKWLHPLKVYNDWDTYYEHSIFNI